MMPTSSFSYTEKRPDNFVLSEETPVSIGHGIWGNLSTSTEPVEVLSYGVHFRIPRNYLENILDNSKDHMVDFALVTLYPDFNGVQSGAEGGKLTEANKIWRWKFSPNLINIATVGGDLGKKRNADYNTEVFKSEEGEPDHPWQYNLLKSTKSNAAILQEVYFQHPTQNNSGTVLFCSKETDVIQECLIYIRVSDNLILRCQFHKELLPHWQEINQKVTKLVQSFIITKEK
jgi:hypothetical protein